MQCCTVLCCTLIYCTVLHYTVLYWTILYCFVLRCTILYFCTVLCCIILRYTVLYCAILSRTVLCFATLYCAVLYCIVLCCTVLWCLSGDFDSDSLPLIIHTPSFICQSFMTSHEYTYTHERSLLLFHLPIPSPLIVTPTSFVPNILRSLRLPLTVKINKTLSLSINLIPRFALTSMLSSDFSNPQDTRISFSNSITKTKRFEA